jgi:hypothetical protein
MIGRRSFWLAVVCAALLVAGAQAAVIISDAFAGHTNNVDLYGTVTDVGNVTWTSGNTSNKGFKFIVPGDYVQSKSNNTNNFVPYAVSSDTAVSADFNYNGSTGSGPKVVLGFEDATITANGYGWLLYLEVAQNGAWSLKFMNTSGSTATSASGSGLVLPSAGFYPLVLQWEPTSKTANAWINGAQVVANKVISGISTNPAANVGFGTNTTNNLLVDNFAVTPDPATMLLLFGGAGLAVLRRR